MESWRFHPSWPRCPSRDCRQSDPEDQIWFGDHAAPVSEQGIRVLGTPLGSDAFVRAQLQATGEGHEMLLSRIPSIQDLQSTWLLLLFCASTRATNHLGVQPTSTHAGVWQCFLQSSGVNISTPLHGKLAVSHCTWVGLGFRSACRTAHAAYWGSWADCLSTIRQRHAKIAQTMVEALVSPPASAIHLVGAASSRATAGFESPFWASAP